MEKTIPPFPFTVAGEEKEINPKYQKNLVLRDPNPKARSTRKLIKNYGSPLPPNSGEMPEGKGGGPVVEARGGGSR